MLDYDREVGDDHLSFIYHGENYYLSLVNGNLILQPGTQIFLKDIDAISFLTDGNCLIMRYQRKGEEYEAILANKESFHIPDISDYIDECGTDSFAEQ